MTEPQRMRDPLWDDVVANATAAEQAYKHIQKRIMDPRDVWGYSWGFTDLDRVTGGIQWEGTKELTTLAARSNTGKSAFAITVALSVAYQFSQEFPDLEVRICLLEMTAQACFMRLFSQIADVPLYNLQRGRVSRLEEKRVEQAQLQLKNLPITWLEGTHNTQAIERFVSAGSKAGKRCGLWIVDHIGIVPSETAKRTGNPTFSLGEVSGEFRRIARKYAPGLVLAQIKRDSLLRKDPTPTAADVYGSDKIMQDTDNHFILHRPDMLTQKSEDERPENELAYLLVEKQRAGEAGRRVPMLFTPRQVLWSDMPEEDEEESRVEVA